MGNIHQLTELAIKTRQMRHAQKMYFQYRTGLWLDRAKELEKEVDAMLERYVPNDPAPSQHVQSDLFS